MVFVWSLPINIIQQWQTEILINSYIFLLILENVWLHHLGIHGCDEAIVDVSFLWQGKSGQIVGDSEAVFSCLYAEGVVDTELVLMISSKHLWREHTVLHVLWEYSVSADVHVGVVLDSVSVDSLYNISKLIPHNKQSWLLWFRFTWLF